MSAVYEHLNRGLALWHEGRFFEAHERWEDAWRIETGPERTVLQVLIQLAASMIKRGEGNTRGAALGLEKARDNLLRALGEARSVLGLDLIELRAGLEHVPPVLPRRTARDRLLYLHGFASGPTSAKAARFQEAARALGFELELPDLNEGGFEHLTVSRALALAERKLAERTIVIGSSFGGYVAALLAARDPRVVALILMAPAFDLGRRLERRYGPDELARWRARGFALVDHYATGQQERIGIELLDDAARHEAMPPITVPAYILHGAHDDTVPASLSEQVKALAPDLVELDVVDDGHDLALTADRAIAALSRAIQRFGLVPPHLPGD